MTEIRVHEGVIDAIRTKGECIVEYRSGHANVQSLPIGRVVAIVGKERGGKAIVEAANRKPGDGVVSIKLKRVTGVG